MVMQEGDCVCAAGQQFNVEAQICETCEPGTYKWEERLCLEKNIFF